MVDNEIASYLRGEKWWGSEGVRPYSTGPKVSCCNRRMAATPLEGGGHDVAVPLHGSMAWTPGCDDADLRCGPLTAGAITAGAVTYPPPVLFSGLEPLHLEATGERVMGADTPKHRIENKH